MSSACLYPEEKERDFAIFYWQPCLQSNNQGDKNTLYITQIAPCNIIIGNGHGKEKGKENTAKEESLLVRLKRSSSGADARDHKYVFVPSSDSEFRSMTGAP